MKTRTSSGKVALDIVSVDRLLERDDALFHGPHLHPEGAARLLEGAGRCPRHASLWIELTVPPDDLGRDAQVREAIACHFERERELAAEEMRKIFHYGRVASAIGLVFVAVLLGIGQGIAALGEGHLATVLSESLTVFAWVSMWRPAELLLYEHWPVRQRRNLAGRLAGADVALCARA